MFKSTKRLKGSGTDPKNSLKDLPPRTINPPPPQPSFDTIKRLANYPPPVPVVMELPIPSLLPQLPPIWSNDILLPLAHKTFALKPLGYLDTLILGKFPLRGSIAFDSLWIDSHHCI
nr:hypothetical protein [Tanacetum cinerariifolium]